MKRARVRAIARHAAADVTLALAAPLIAAATLAANHEQRRHNGQHKPRK